MHKGDQGATPSQLCAAACTAEFSWVPGLLEAAAATRTPLPSEGRLSHEPSLQPLLGGTVAVCTGSCVRPCVCLGQCRSGQQAKAEQYLKSTLELVLCDRMEHWMQLSGTQSAFLSQAKFPMQYTLCSILSSQRLGKQQRRLSTLASPLPQKMFTLSGLGITS